MSRREGGAGASTAEKIVSSRIFVIDPPFMRLEPVTPSGPTIFGLLGGGSGGEEIEMQNAMIVTIINN